MAKFYIATALANTLKYEAVRARLQAGGHSLTFDWLEAGPVDQTSVKDMAKRSRDDLGGINDADCVIVILPGGFGTHVELGYALRVASTKVIIWAEGGLAISHPQAYPCVFHCDKDAALAEGDMDGLFRWIRLMVGS